MDLYTEAGFPPDKQITSTDPGNVPDGLFWTVPIDPDNLNVNLGHDTARLTVRHLATKDFHDIVNDLMHGPSVPAAVSFDIRWSGVIKPYHLRDKTNRFVFDGVQDTAPMTCTASVPTSNIEFVSDPAATSTTLFSVLGHERNGHFFPKR